MTHACTIALLAILLPLWVMTEAHGASWRSELYPVGWTPDFTLPDGRFLHDWSYAGYARGERPLPRPAGPVFDVTAAPYRADAGGGADATAAIQAAIDDAAARGGGVVYLPAGTYRVRPPSDSAHQALLIESSNIVLRGAGTGRTFLFCDHPAMRERAVIAVRAPGSTADTSFDFSTGNWNDPLPGSTVLLSADLPARSFRVPLPPGHGFATGDWVVLNADVTEAWVRDHFMAADQQPLIDRPWDERLLGLLFYRRVVAAEAEAIVLDIPTRYPLLRRDKARVYRIRPHLEAVGIEDLSVGMRRVQETGIDDTRSYTEPGTGGYDAHDSTAILLTHVVDSWLHAVDSYAPPGNDGYHLQSNFVTVDKSRGVTIRDCDVSDTQYQGGGSNGYGFRLKGQDCLLVDCSATRTRHGASIQQLWASGNVIRDCHFSDNRHSVDFHKHLSPGNLLDRVTVENDYLASIFRKWGGETTGLPQNGHSSTMSCFWNTRGPGRGGRAVQSEQFGRGYVIGTEGGVDTATDIAGSDPRDHVEGVGKAAGLVPQSLHADQLARRLATGGGGGGGGSNRPPTGRLASPADGSSFTAPADVTVVVEASDSDGRIERVQLFLDGQAVRIERNAPYIWEPDLDPVLKAMPPGRYELRAVIADDDGAQTEVRSTFSVVDVSNGVYRETGGQVVLEAEKPTGGASGSGSAASSAWRRIDTLGGSSGAAMRAEPDAGVNVGDTTDGPRLDYAIDFATAGTWYVWVRLLGPAGSSDSVHAGLDGVPATYGGIGMSDGGGVWHWEELAAGRRVTFAVASPGVRVFSLWMREDGVAVDRIALTTDAGFVPGGSGPAADPLDGAPSRTITLAVRRGGSPVDATVELMPGGATASGSSVRFDGLDPAAGYVLAPARTAVARLGHR